MARKPDPGARERILAAASRLFFAHGVRAVGLQQIIDACGCGKNVLYREFGSKDALVAAYLERFARDWQIVLEEATEAAPQDPARQLAVIVERVAARAGGNGFRGCALSNVHAEFPDLDHPLHRYVVDHYAARLATLRDIARRTAARDPDALARRISLIIDGINTNAGILGGDGSLTAAVAFAREAITVATAPPQGAEGSPASR
ncbi:TetR/AcrR family transcriptional regulator [Streptomyces sp. MP131-18]|uniref:TetR/AcrR family transcriptional regulator n=1 Tax=Streptomyces sp. MP131-18 TaxID=1857892 RepID=UPI00097BF6C8|nr:TetR/AcrR family transcriptional regulator [Streptomyces sp. MP131-18]ONK10872.1 putative transcriptional regulator [Streptomyces sp. MP131-18]